MNNRNELSRARNRQESQLAARATKSLENQSTCPGQPSAARSNQEEPRTATNKQHTPEAPKAPAGDRPKTARNSFYSGRAPTINRVALGHTFDELNEQSKKFLPDVLG